MGPFKKLSAGAQHVATSRVGLSASSSIGSRNLQNCKRPTEVALHAGQIRYGWGATMRTRQDKTECRVQHGPLIQM